MPEHEDPAASTPPRSASRLPLNLALQGGGSHGAFTWGVLDTLLEDGQWDFDGISGTSAGAMNAVAVAHGFAQAAREHRNTQDAHAAGCALARATLSRFWEGVGAVGTLFTAPLLSSKPLLGMMSQWLSPYQTNPLDFNPLRSLLEREVDFELLRATRAAHVPKVFVCATNVRTGRGEIFHGKRLSADAVMASACLPLLFKAVQIEGEHYWDGGFSGNPALHPLVYQTECCDTLLVQINPMEHPGLIDTVPDTVPEIVERMNDITFNASLLAELRSIEFVRRLLAEGRLDARRYKDMRMHHVDGGALLHAFGTASKSRADLGLVRKLFALGREAGQNWLAAHRADVGQRASMQIAENI